MKISIRFKLFFIVISMIFMFFGISVLFNVFFLQKYYNEENKNMFIKMFNHYEESKNSRGRINNETEKLERLSGAKVFIADYNYKVKQSNMKPRDEKERKEPPLYKGIVDKIEKNRYSKMDNNRIILVDKYVDDRMGLEMFLVVFVTHSNDYFIVEKPIDAIKDSAKIANRFSLISGIIILISGLILAVLLSKRMVKPVLQIDRILKRIAKLDFTERYTGKTGDEIGSLGMSLNSISAELQNGIKKIEASNSLLSIELDKTKKMESTLREFISDSSHELKTPIALIKCYAEGLKSGIFETEADRKSYYNIILEESDKMGVLVSTLLEISELDSGETKIEKEECNIGKITENIISKYGPLFVEKDIELNVSIEKDKIIYCDIFKISQVIENFLCNAINHTEGKEKKIKIFSEIRDEFIRVTVFNTGKNIPVEICDKIWNDFYKEDKARTRSYGGAGLGLAIVRRIIKLHNGNYGVINRPDGIEFWFELKK